MDFWGFEKRNALLGDRFGLFEGEGLTSGQGMAVMGLGMAASSISQSISQGAQASLYANAQIQTAQSQANAYIQNAQERADTIKHQSDNEKDVAIKQADMMIYMASQTSLVAQFQAMTQLAGQLRSDAAAVQIAYKNAEVEMSRNHEQYALEKARIDNERLSLEIQARQGTMIDTSSFRTA